MSKKRLINMLHAGTNELLRTAVLIRYESINQMCREDSRLNGKARQISSLITLKRPPYEADGTLREICVTLSDLLGVSPDQMFPTVGMCEWIRRQRVFKKQLSQYHWRAWSKGAPYQKFHERFIKLVLDDCTSLEEQAGWVRDALLQMDDFPATVIMLRFGLDGGEKLNLRQIGQMVDRGRERIRQVEAQALRPLRQRVVSNWKETYARVDKSSL